MTKRDFNYDKVLKKLTTEQKAKLLTGNGWWNTYELKELGIETVFMSDGPHGLRTQKDKADHLGLNKSLPATCFPSESTTANSFDRKLLEKIGSFIAKEAVGYGVDLVLGPGVNIKRSPLCGRNFEYFSEDPVLSGELAAAFINGVQSEGVGACIKHFALNNTENKRFLSDSIADKQTMREIYLKAFEIAIKKSDPMAVMTAYNKVNGEYSSENTYLLKDTLRNEWGYDGLVLSDWGAVSDKARSVKAGLDLEMPDSHGLGYQNILTAIENGSLTVNELDRAVLCVLKLARRAADNKAARRQTTTAEDADRAALSAAKESMVLLKNLGALPLKKDDTVLVLGEAAKTPHYQGGGSSHINATIVSSLLDGLKALGVKYNYIDGITNDGNGTLELVEAARNVAPTFDKVIFAVSHFKGTESEGYDRTSLALPSGINDLILRVSPLTKKSIVLLYVGAPVELPWLDKVDSVLFCGLPGQAGGLATASILTGKISPSGKLAETWPKAISDTPSYHCPPLGTKVHYHEGQFVGYRWYLSRKTEPMFCFGAGLSYTEFDYKNIDFSNENGTYRVSVNATNIGKVKGAATVMLFCGSLCSPSSRPQRELRDFEKVWLEAGETQKIEFKFDNEFFVSFNDDGKKTINTGEYLVELGTSVKDILFSTKTLVFGERKAYSLDSSLGELFMHPAAAGLLTQIFQSRSGEDGKSEFSDMVVKMAADLPLRALGTFMPKEFTSEAIDKILSAIGGNR